MKWDFESAFIPLVSKFAPSDSFKIWKKGNAIRLDYSLVGFKNLKTKRRKMTLLYNPKMAVESKKVVKFNSAANIVYFW